MAKRTFYIPDLSNNSFVKTELAEFKWHPGLSKKQKQKNIFSFHNVIKKSVGDKKILDISSKSPSDYGVKLSAFSLFLFSKDNKKYTVESAYQSSKVFEQGGPYLDLLDKTPKEAKKDDRLKESGNLKKFLYHDYEWPLEPKTLFYDWLYITALSSYSNLYDEIMNYEVFTDIEFNPEKSFNCQAHSAALYVSLRKKNLLNDALESIKKYIKIINQSNENLIYKEINDQYKLF